MDVPCAYPPLCGGVLTFGLAAAVTLSVAYLLGKLFAFIPATTTGYAPVALPRGKRQSLCHAPIHPQFAPAFHPPDDSSSRWMRWLIDDVVTPKAKAIVLAGTAFIVRKFQGIFSMSSIKKHAEPIGTRLQRGIAQVSTLQDAFASQTIALAIPYRYLCPASFLLGLFVGLVFVVGAPTEIATLFCFGGILFVVAGDVGASEPEESEGEGGEEEEEVDDAPLDADMNSIIDTAGLVPTVALHAQL